MPLWQLCIVAAAGLLSACNMVISETPMFGDSDRATLAPRDGIWLSEDGECRFDAARPEAEWPDCAMWVVVHESGRELEVSDGKRQSQQLRTLFVSGSPAIIEALWIDDAKEPPGAFYGYYAFEPEAAAPETTFMRASLWPVECGVQSGSSIRPFPGIGPECRPSSKDAIRAAAVSSRRAEQVKEWRWLRPDRR